LQLKFAADHNKWCVRRYLMETDGTRLAHRIRFVVKMQKTEYRQISEVLGKMSFRSGLGYAVFFLLVMLPTADAWQSGTEVEQISGRESLP